MTAMKKHPNLMLLSCAALLLVSSPALANHCAADLAEVQQRLSEPTSASANALEAAAALVQSALTACDHEEAEIVAAPADAAIREPGYVTVGRSMLVNALQLIDVR
jgi:hypothetical protein